MLKIEPADLGDLGRMLAFLREAPAPDLPAVADIAVVDDGSARDRRGDEPARAPQPPVPRGREEAAEGGSSPSSSARREFPKQAAADPSAFALKIRRALGDEQRSLRLYGSEVVIGRLTGDAARARLHLVNYGGRDIEGLRVRVRGRYAATEALVAGPGRGARRGRRGDRRGHGVHGRPDGSVRGRPPARR